jgi:Xaa-Pro aminopeptidase
MKNRRWLALITLLIFPFAARGQSVPYYQPHFPAEEFKARWEKIFERLGDRAVAILQGMPQVDGFIFPRQGNEFFYLCGIETPHSYLVLDGKSRKVALYLPPRNRRLESAEGRVLSADDADLVKKLTGVDEVFSTQSLKEDQMPQFKEAQIIFTPFAPAEGNAQSRGELRSARAGITGDYWDGRESREAHFTKLLRTRFPQSEVRDLSPILDQLRAVKSLREIALIRRASQLAGLGIIEAIKSTKPGVFEYQLDAAARYVFLVNGARLEGYRSIVGAGTSNIFNMHYYRNSDELKDGDLVLMDYAPDYGYYVSDIARMWPVNGKFAPWQRELVQFVLDYRNAIIPRIRPGVTPAAIQAEAKTAMEAVFQKTKFSKPAYEKAAHTLVDRGGGVFSHPVGMAVHDDGNYNQGPLKPGHVFSIDPQLRVPEENLYIRYEDVVVVTENGVENFTDFLPSELADLENLVGKNGVVQKVPPTSEEKVKRPIVLIDPPEKDFFSKILDFHGIPIKAHQVVVDEALYAAHDRLSLLFAHLLTNQPMVISNLVAAGAELHIIGRDQVTTDLPEWRHDKGVPRPEYNGLTRDQRTRGMGGRLTSCGEENLLKLEKDRYRGRDICLHEFSHSIRNNGIPREVRAKFDEQYRRSLDQGRWQKSYAGSNPDEFFAELTMWYFGTHGDLHMTGPKPEDGREGLKKYDPEAFALMDEFYSGRIAIPKVERTNRRRGADAGQPGLMRLSANSGLSQRLPQR